MTLRIGRRGFLGSALAGRAPAPSPRLRRRARLSAPHGRPDGRCDRALTRSRSGAARAASSTSTVEYSTDRNFARRRRARAVRATAASDYTVRITVAGLAPATRYYYRLLVDGIPDRYRLTPFATRTAPAGRGAVPARLRLLRAPPARRRAADLPRDRRRRAGRLLLARRQHLRRLRVGVGVRGGLPAPARDRVDAAAACAASRSSRSGTTTTSGSTTRTRTNPVRDAALAAFSNYWANPVVRPADAPGRLLPVRVRRRRFLHARRALLPHAEQDARRAGQDAARPAPGRVAARGAARKPRAVQGDRLRQRLVRRGRPDRRHLGALS